LQARRLVESVEGLNSSPAHSVPELCPHKAMCEHPVFTQTTWINPAAKGVDTVHMMAAQPFNFSTCCHLCCIIYQNSFLNTFGAAQVLP